MADTAAPVPPPPSATGFADAPAAPAAASSSSSSSSSSSASAAADAMPMAPAPPSSLLGKIELTQQPEKVFYKDEGGQRWYYLFVFFVVRGKRTTELKRAFDKVADGRRKIPVDCLLLYDQTMEEVEDQNMLQLLGSSREDSDVSDGTPEFDPGRGTGSIRYRINKVSMRKDNSGFRLRIKLRGLDDIIAPAITEPTQVLSKRKRLRKLHRAPEQTARNRVEAMARRRNEEVEEKMSREHFSSTPLIHRILSEPTLTPVPDYPDLKQNPELLAHEADNMDLGGAAAGGGAGPAALDLAGSGLGGAGGGNGGGLTGPASKRQRVEGHKMYVEMDAVKNRLSALEKNVQMILGIVQQLMPSYAPDGQGQHQQQGSSGHGGPLLGSGASLPMLHDTLTSLLKGFSTAQDGGTQNNGGSAAAASSAAAHAQAPPPPEVTGDMHAAHNVNDDDDDDDHLQDHDGPPGVPDIVPAASEETRKPGQLATRKSARR